MQSRENSSFSEKAKTKIKKRINSFCLPLTAVAHIFFATFKKLIIHLFKSTYVLITPLALRKEGFFNIFDRNALYWYREPIGWLANQTWYFWLLQGWR